MLISQKIKVGKKSIQGVLLKLATKNLIILRGSKGYVMCGYLNISAANKLGDIAGRVTGVRDFDDVLNADIIEISENAKKMGLKTGMKGKDFLKKLM